MICDMKKIKSNKEVETNKGYILVRAAREGVSDGPLPKRCE